MGAGSYSTATYATKAATRSATGASAFGYTDVAMAGKRHDELKAHDLVDPYGVTVRESRDSTEHPTSVPIVVMCDVTGSMANYPRIIQSKFPDLFNLLLLKGYVKDPQLLFGAIGDAHGDAVPLQASQFESDNRNDENIEALYLEGRGGGSTGSLSNHESYDLALYFLARHTAHDAKDVRGKKGYAFIMGDEVSYETVEPALVKQYIGSDCEDGLTLDAIIAEVQDLYELYIIIPEDHSGRCVDFWRDKVGDSNVILLKDVSEICSTIGLQIGLREGTVASLDDGLNDLDPSSNVAAVRKALTVAP